MIIVSSVDLELMLMIKKERIIGVHLFACVKFHSQFQARLFNFYRLQSLKEINTYLLSYYFFSFIKCLFHSSFKLFENFIFLQRKLLDQNFNFILNFEFKFLSLVP